MINHVCALNDQYSIRVFMSVSLFEFSHFHFHFGWLSNESYSHFIFKYFVEGINHECAPALVSEWVIIMPLEQNISMHSFGWLLCGFEKVRNLCRTLMVI